MAYSLTLEPPGGIVCTGGCRTPRIERTMADIASRGQTTPRQRERRSG